MKNTLKEKFKNNVLVKPLYKRLKNDNKVKPIMVISVDNVKLDGHGIKVKSDSIKHNSDVFKLKNIRQATKKLYLCESCECLNNNNIFKKLRKGNLISYGMEGSTTVTTEANSEVFDKQNTQDKTNKRIQTVDNKKVLYNVPCSWLRVYPQPQSPGESVGSVIFRCMFCQLGLATFLVMWTAIWVFVIHYFEAPAEVKMYRDFEYQQNKHVIDLATELRMISPLSFKWREAIKKRISEASETSVTLLKDDRIPSPTPGEYWSLSGTFLFTIYVMTALGLGAPVPQTFEGRGAVLVYSALAIPVHFYLMMNTSMCIIVHAQTYRHQFCTRKQDRKPFVSRKTALDNGSRLVPLPPF